MDKFIISKQEDFLEAAAMLAKDHLSLGNLKIDENFYLVVKIDDPKWGDSSYLDYKKASVVIKLQEDIISIYNIINKEKVNIKDLNKNEELVIKVRIEDGCIEYIIKFLDIFNKITSNMTTEQQFICFLSVVGIVFSGIVAWAGVKIYGTHKNEQIESKKLEFALKIREIDEKEKNAILDSLNTALIGMSRRHTTANYIRDNISENGMASVGLEQMVPKNEIPSAPDVIAPVIPREITMMIDGIFPIKKYDFETQNVQIALGSRSAWFSTKHMIDSEKKKIIAIAEKSILQERALRETLQINAIKQEDNKISGIIIAIGNPREGSVDYMEFLNAKFEDQIRDKIIPLPIDVRHNK